MAKNSMTEKQVLGILDIPDWRHLSKDKMMTFISILPELDNDVACRIIEQFPDFAKTCVSMVSTLKELCDKALQEDAHSTDQSIDAYRVVLDSLANRLNDGELSSEEAKYITEKMVEIADKISLKDSEGKEFKAGVIKTVAETVLGVVLVGASLLGVKFLGDKFGR